MSNEQSSCYNLVKSEFERLLKFDVLHQSDCYNLHEFKPHWNGKYFMDFDFVKDVSFKIEVYDKDVEYPEKWCSFSRNSDVVDNALFGEEEYRELKQMCDDIFEKIDYNKIFDYEER